MRVEEEGKLKHSFKPNENVVSIAVPDDQLIFIEDYNFDGHNDVRIYKSLAADGVNTNYEYWILDPVTDQYIFSPEYSTITHPEVHKNEKEIVSIWRKGCCMTGTDVYKIIAGRPEVTRRVVKIIEYGIPKLEIYNRVNNQLVLEK
ncbi:MAG: hypothetical protein WBG46_13335 [Nonlabens sp.]